MFFFFLRKKNECNFKKRKKVICCLNCLYLNTKKVMEIGDISGAGRFAFDLVIFGAQR